MTDNQTILREKLITIFPDATLRQQVLAKLHEYGQEPTDNEPDRVHLAILKLAGSSLEQICNWMRVAKQDYRDVLASAEYPNQMKFQTWKLPEVEQRRIESEDLEQYEKWIKGK